MASDNALINSKEGVNNGGTAKGRDYPPKPEAEGNGTSVTDKESVSD